MDKQCTSMRQVPGWGLIFFITSLHVSFGVFQKLSISSGLKMLRERVRAVMPLLKSTRHLRSLVGCESSRQDKRRELSWMCKETSLTAQGTRQSNISWTKRENEQVKDGWKTLKRTINVLFMKFTTKSFFFLSSTKADGPSLCTLN